ncbi:GntR family transcriptional regulator [Roseivirga sp. BDSF3-8]|uniref:GntR family transcriptional regulator n=1 Tax=Roseivirga sp. BDSF3-8 TaxID=3241598 RepID=UPI0035321B98
MAKKISLHQHIRSLIYDQLLEGTLKPGQRVSLTEFSKLTKSTPTQVREVFARFEQTGAVKFVPKKGFTVNNLNKVEAIASYKFIGTLQEFAMGETVYSEQNLSKLKKAYAAIQAAKAPADVLKEELAFHELLISDCKNKIAPELIRNLKLPLYKFELRFIKAGQKSRSSLLTYNQIVSLIEDENYDEAAELARAHWRLSSMELSGEEDRHKDLID